VAGPASATALTEEILPRGFLRVGEIDWFGMRGNRSNRIVLKRALRRLDREFELRERRGESEQEAEVVAIAVSQKDHNTPRLCYPLEEVRRSS
jgi:hypothetical protein